jgi:hypothetical protein
MENSRFDVGTVVDLLDMAFGWRGRYIVMAQKSHFHLVKIRNMGTNSQQFVSPDRLRLSRLSQFFLKSLQGKP